MRIAIEETVNVDLTRGTSVGKWVMAHSKDSREKRNEKCGGQSKGLSRGL